MLVGVLVCGALVRPVRAHPAPFSYLDIVFRNGGIEGTLVVHVIDIAHELGDHAAGARARPEVLGRQRASGSSPCSRRGSRCAATAA